MWFTWTKRSCFEHEMLQQLSFVCVIWLDGSWSDNAGFENRCDCVCRRWEGRSRLRSLLSKIIWKKVHPPELDRILPPDRHVECVCIWATASPRPSVLSWGENSFYSPDTASSHLEFTQKHISLSVCTGCDHISTKDCAPAYCNTNKILLWACNFRSAFLEYER